MKVCKAQLNDTNKIKWLEWYTDSDETPAEQKYEDETVSSLQDADEELAPISEPTDFGEADEIDQGLKPIQIAFRSLGVIVYAMRGFNGLSNNLYWYEKGFNAARSLSLLNVLYMDLTPNSEHWIKPMHAWDRFIDL